MHDTLLQAIGKTIHPEGRSITFKRDILQVEITIRQQFKPPNEHPSFVLKQCLPKADHFYEEKIISCLEWMNKEINFKTGM